MPVFDIWGKLSNHEELKQRGIEPQDEVSSCPPPLLEEDHEGDLIQEDIDMPFAGELFPPVAPSAAKRARLLPPESPSPTTSRATTSDWCARDYERVVKREKTKVRSFFDKNTTTVLVSGFGHTKEFKLPKQQTPRSK
ncbi:unnamed protein product [Mucor hiemalis]